MSKLDTGPKASSTAVKTQNQRTFGNSLKNTNSNNTFTSTFSDELTSGDLVKKTFSETSNNKNHTHMDSMYSSLSGQSSLGIFELENISDIGNTLRKDTFPINIQSNQSVLQHRLSQATELNNTLARASSVKNIFNKDLVRDNSHDKTSLTNITNAFKDMLKENMNISYSSFSSEDFVSGSDFKKNLAEIEEINRKEFGSLSESRFNFSLDGEKQSITNGSFAARYFAAKSVPVEDLSLIFPKRQNKNKTFTKEFKEKNYSFLASNDGIHEEQTNIGYNTIPSITSWTDSNVTNNLLNLTSLSDISEVLTSENNPTNSKELTKVLLSEDLFNSKSLNEFSLQRRFSTSTRFSNASQNLEHAQLSFPSLKSFNFDAFQKVSNKNENHIKLDKSASIKKIDEHFKNEENINSTLTQCLTFNKNNLSDKYDKKQINIHNDCHFILTPKIGYFEDCSSESIIMGNNIDLSNFSILTNDHDVFSEMSINKSTNVSKIVYCNETLHEDKLNKFHVESNSTSTEILDIGDICIGTYSQVVITLENRLNIDAKYSLKLLEVLFDNTKNNSLFEIKPVTTNIATVLCSDKDCIIPALTEASFTIGIIPLVSGNISVYIKLESNDISQEIYRKIQICSIVPQINWINNSFGSIDFGLLPELSQKSFPIKLLNNGTYQVPIKFILNQDQCENIVEAKAIINPSELWQCDLNILTPSIFKKNSKSKLITGRLQIILDSAEELSNNYSPLLYCSNLSGRVCLTNISFDQNPLILKKNKESTLNSVVEISNDSELPISLFVKQSSKQLSELTIQPDRFKLAINEKIKVTVTYIPTKSFNYLNETSIYLQVVSSQKQFIVQVKFTESNSELHQINSPNSRPISPWSTSSSTAVGQLELQSTCSSIIWGSVPSNTKSVQTFTLRNRGSHKEKLLLSVKDNKNCFKLISSGEKQVSEMKLLLEPMESQKLSVALISTSNEGQAYGQVILQRQHSNEKRVISLFGYCGHSNIIIQGAFEDNFGNKWLYPNSQFMTAQFSITNSGNTTAFVKIFQEISLEDIIEPNEFILKKGETTNVTISIVMSPERLEMLIEHDSNSKIININKISLFYGDEVSRVRVSRLWTKIKNEKKVVYPDQQRLEEISNMFNGINFVNVDLLADSEKSLLKLWKTDISEDSIVVLMERSNLESLLCDTTTVFSELDTTVINRLP